jgi:hypothetical protein
LGIYYKRNSYTDEADFLEILFAISAMTNIRNLFSQAYKVSPLLAKQKKTYERIKAPDEQTQRATVEHTANLKRIAII